MTDEEDAAIFGLEPAAARILTTLCQKPDFCIVRSSVSREPVMIKQCWVLHSAGHALTKSGYILKFY